MQRILLLMLLALLSACNRVNQLDSPDRQQVVDWADKRKADYLIETLQHDDEQLAELAALKLASVQDEAALPYLLQIAENPNKTNALRKAALFAIGLTDVNAKTSDQLALMIPLMANEAELMEDLIPALGRSNKYFEDYLGESIDIAKNAKAIAMAAVYHSVNFRLNAKLREILISLAGNKDEETRLYAAAALSRSYLNEENCRGIAPLIVSENKESVLYFLITSCKSCNLPEELLQSIIIKTKNNGTLVKLGASKGLKQFDRPEAHRFLYEMIKQGNHSEQEAAAYSLSLYPSNQAFETVSSILKSDFKSHFIAEALLFEALLKRADYRQADSISGIIAEKIQNSSNDYYKMAFIRSMGAHYTNFTWLQTEAFGTESILVRLASIEGILKIRKSPDFNLHNQQWVQNAPKSKTLFQLCSETIQQALETYDVSLCAEISEFLMDTGLVKDPSNSMRPFAVSLSDTSVFTRAIRKMKLPRDNETYHLLKKVRAFYASKKPPLISPTEFNNPIDWQLLNRIPQHQEVKFITSKGEFQLRLFINEAPATTGFFMKLIKEGYFVGKYFHRVVPGFVIQGGCPRGDGFGGLMQTIRTEISRLRFNKEGMLGMASAGKDTESSQFFVTLAPTPHLDGRYTIFGEVSKGMDVVKQITVGDRITETAIMP
jgi:cyclophilin family peptidyl-prolyl cis-trans isomerase/HEAT repeat protein